MALVAIATGLSAQLTPRAESVGVVVRSGATSTMAFAGQDVTHGLQLQLADALGQASYGFSPAWDSTGLTLAWNTSAVALRSTSAAVDGGTRHELYLGRPVRGQFVVYWQPSGNGTGAAAFEFDLFGDGVVELADTFVATGGATGGWPVTLPVNLPAGRSDLVVRVSAGATAGTIAGPWGIRVPYQGAAQGRLDVRFEPDSCAAVLLGAGCGAPATTIASNFVDGATIRATPGPEIDLVLAVLGVDQLTGLLPLAPHCPLHMTPLASLLQVAVPSTVNSWSLARPVGAPALAFAVQVVGLDIETLTAPSGPAFWVACP